MSGLSPNISLYELSSLMLSAAIEFNKNCLTFALCYVINTHFSLWLSCQFVALCVSREGTKFRGSTTMIGTSLECCWATIVYKIFIIDILNICLFLVESDFTETGEIEEMFAICWFTRQMTSNNQSRAKLNLEAKSSFLVTYLSVRSKGYVASLSEFPSHNQRPGSETK